MATGTITRQTSGLVNGDRMNRAEFHRLYEGSAEDFRAELIGGIVFAASPLRLDHGSSHVDLATVLGAYRAATPGVDAGDNVTVLLGDDSEPQPDLFLRVLPEWGGQSRTSDNRYVTGAPELVIEIAHSSRALDLHAKYDDYARFGVLEYLVACVEEKELRWFDLPHDRELQADADGIVRSRTFPGLWIDGAALFAADHARILATAQGGVASSEHATFVARLAERKSQPSSR